MVPLLVFSKLLRVLNRGICFPLSSLLLWLMFCLEILILFWIWVLWFLNSLPRGCMQLSHLSFADDIIIFINSGISCLCVLMGFLDWYEKCSGQKINHSKCSFYISPWISRGRIDQIGNLTGFQKESSLYLYRFSYLWWKKANHLFQPLTKFQLGSMVGIIIF